MKRTLALALAAVTATSMVGATAVAAPSDKANEKAHTAPHGKAKGHDKADNPNKGPGSNNGKKGTPPGQMVDVQLLHTSDFHGRIQHAPQLGALTYELRAEAGDRNSVTVSSGDNIGGSTFESGLFHDEPTIDVLNELGLDAASVGNHEFDEGVDELMRMVHGGNHPEDGQYLETPYQGADFPYLAANVVWKDSGETILPPYHVERIQGVEVAFIGIVTSTTPALVSPSGVAAVDFLDEAETINAYAEELQAQGIDAIFVTMHEGGYAGDYPDVITTESVNAGCDGLSGAVLDINEAVTPAVDGLLTGHTHAAYICDLPDPDGVLRPVTSSGDYARVLTEIDLQVDRRSGDVVRDSVDATNHVVDLEGVGDPAIQSIVDKWMALSDVFAAQVVGTVAEDITGDSNSSRATETPMADLIADVILWGTQDAESDVAFMNVGGVRSELLVDEISAGEAPGEITYAEAYDVAPFGNLLVTLEMTGAQIEEVLNQQYQPIDDRGTRPMLALGVSEGFSYTWNPDTMSVVEGSMYLHGEPIDLDATYRVGTLNFLAEGGDSFTAFTEGTLVAGGPEDLANLVAYLEAHPDLEAPEDRVNGL
ncbi:bifunctional metallophosphatase/5'-nucleotidase [Ornithinimicrobium kibberense]|uniref:Bifunctional metallophosphatase/5'-nucleotidase n=1 Tax=Ornithinimicrobium kibberense TaxID=282060 RepID=A0ABV5V2F2_9MICO|nr:bifunctional metallophosphatase/5'-nucleotidase [Ornithinimicrobium kibberense]